jgi:hypothetical protein
MSILEFLSVIYLIIIHTHTNEVSVVVMSGIRIREVLGSNL